MIRFRRYTAKMIYIVSGVLQVLTEDDAETPILSLSSGTILGEGMLLQPSKCRADVRSATHSELHVLDATSLYRLLHLYPEVAKHLCEKRIVRAVVARNLQRFKNEQSGARYRDGISWLKTRWLAIGGIAEHDVKFAVPLDLVPIDGTRTSRYLDLLALSEKVELMSDAVCLRMSCPCILEPESNFLSWWERANVLMSIVVIWLYPFYIAFTETFPNWLLLLDTIFIIVRIIDLFIQVSTATKLPDQPVIVDVVHLLRLKLQDASFFVDIIVTLPVELFMIVFGTGPSNKWGLSHYSRSVYRINRLLTIYRLYKYIRKVETNFQTNIETVRICRSLFTLAIVAYWLATAMYSFSCHVQACGLDSWIGYYSNEETETRGQKELFENPLVVTIYYAFNTLISLGVTKLLPRNNWEILQLDGVLLLSLVMYVYFCAELGATYIIHNDSENKVTEHLTSVTKFLTLHGNSPDIISRVRNHLCAQWEYNKSNGNCSEGKQLLTVACDDLYDKIIIRSIVKTLKALPLFDKGDNTAFLDMLARKAKVFLLTKDTAIAQAGLKTTAVYVLRNGHCRVVSALPSDVDRNRSEIVGPGSMILVVEFLHNTNNLADVHTVTTCEIISIQHSDFWDTLNMFPDIKAQFENAIDHNYFTGKTIERRKQAEEGPKLNSLDESATILQQYRTPFGKLGIFSIIRYLLLRRGIDPNGKNLGKWEKYREAACFLSAVFYPKFFTSLVAYPQVRQAGYLLDIVGLVDIYLRLHVSYYNDNGIYVSHPLSTAKHYLSTSFPADIVASFPLELFALQNAFGRDKAHLTKAWFYLTTRPLLLLRIFGSFAALKNDIRRSHKSLAYLKFLISTGVMLNALSCANMLHICEFHYSEGVYLNIECSQYSWLSESVFKKYEDPLAVYAITVYFYCTFMLRCGNGVILAVKMLEMIVMMLVSSTVMPAWWLMVAQITCNKVGGDLSLTSHRQEMQSLLRYLKAQEVSPQLISLTMDEVEHRWKCSKESDWKKLFQTLPSQLHEEVAMELHGPTLARVSLFKEQDSSATRLLACQVDETCYRRGTTIIRRNEVQGNVYIIRDGSVDVLAADDTCISTLGSGSLFGSFRRRKPARHTMQMIARGHVLLFVISADKFYNIVDHFPVIQARLSNATVLDAEFIDSRVMTSDADESSDQDVENETDSKLIFVSQKSTWYKCFNWTLCFPVSMMSVYLVTSQISLQALNLPTNLLIYICDLFFLVKIYLGFHTDFVDEKSGGLVANYKQSVSKYLRGRNRFPLDLLCCIPIEVLAYASNEPAVRARLFTTLKLNRLLRLFHVFNFRATGHRQLYINPVTSVVFLCAANLMFVHMGVCLWIFVTCRESGCRYEIPPNEESRFATTRIEAMQLAYVYNFDLLTAVGTHIVQPGTLPEILTTIFLIFLYQVLALNLLTSLATFIHFSQYTFANFEIQAKRLYSFMESRSLSAILLQRIWAYCLQQWVRQRGAWMPSMLSSTPNFLQHRIMFDTYGYLLVESDIFRGLHEDFLYQLTARMKRCVYFPKNYIVQEGDVDHTMYFIHSGQVKVLSKPNPSVQGLGSILGVKQGVTNALPHFSDVIALTVTDVMSLHVNAWKDLLSEFPSAEIILSRRISEISEYY